MSGQACLSCLRLPSPTSKQILRILSHLKGPQPQRRQFISIAKSPHVPQHSSIHHFDHIPHRQLRRHFQKHLNKVFSGYAWSRRSYSSEPLRDPTTSKSNTQEEATSNPSASDKRILKELRESPLTLPNAITIARIISCPILGYYIVQGQFGIATSILFFSGFSDWLDGYLARKWNQHTVLGSILDPAADKALMTTLVGTLAWAGLLPIPLAVLIFGRDVALSLSAFYFRYISLPKPRTLQRYFNPSIPSAEVKPTQISKVNTALQLILMGSTLVNPILPFTLSPALEALQWTVAGTTIWSGLSYIGSGGYKILKQPNQQ